MSAIWSSHTPPISPFYASPLRHHRSPYSSSISPSSPLSPMTISPIKRSDQQRAEKQDEQDDASWLHAAAATALASANETLPQPSSSPSQQQQQQQQQQPNQQQQPRQPQSQTPSIPSPFATNSPWSSSSPTATGARQHPFRRLLSPPPLSLAPSQTSPSTTIIATAPPTNISPPSSPPPPQPFPLSISTQFSQYPQPIQPPQHHHSPLLSHCQPPSSPPPPPLLKPQQHPLSSSITSSPPPPAQAPTAQAPTAAAASPPPPPTSATASQSTQNPAPPTPSPHPTRSVILRNLPPGLDDATIRTALEAFGPLRDLGAQLRSRGGRGALRATYYDLRHAKRCVSNLHGVIRWGRRLDVRFTSGFIMMNNSNSSGSSSSNNNNTTTTSNNNPTTTSANNMNHSIDDDHNGISSLSSSNNIINQGTLVVFNLEAGTSAEDVRRLFGIYGDVKEIRETPNKRHHKFVEFFDIRDAERALKALNKTEIGGKRIKIEISRPGGRAIANCRNGLNGSNGGTTNSGGGGSGGGAGAGVGGVGGHVNVVGDCCAVCNGVSVNGRVASPRRRLSIERVSSCSGGNACSSNVGIGGVGVNASHGHSCSSLSSSSLSSGYPTNGDKVNSKFVLDIDKVINGQDLRTALMIRNIPNKYNQKMLVGALEENHRGHFDFFYLPIDFKNKCNVGYAFINFIETKYIPEFYEEFHGKKWGRFNSEKICCITYARIQGKSNLIAHFQNSSLMNEDPKCQPVVFDNQGRREHFPVGPHVRTRRGPSVREARSLENSPHCSPRSHFHHHHHHHHHHHGAHHHHHHRR